jgi:hypothetical protein
VGTAVGSGQGERRGLAGRGRRGHRHDELLRGGQRLLHGGIGILREQGLQVVIGLALGAVELLRRLFLLVLGAVREARAAARCRRQGYVAEAVLRAHDVSMVGPVLDLSTGAQPVLLKRVVALDDVLQLEALGGVADLRLAQGVEATVDVLTGHRWLELLDADEVLLVQGAEPLDSRLELVQRNVDVASRCCHAQSGSGVTRRLSKQTRTCQSLKPKCS